MSFYVGWIRDLCLYTLNPSCRWNLLTDLRFLAILPDSVRSCHIICSIFDILGHLCWTPQHSYCWSSPNHPQTNAAQQEANRKTRPLHKFIAIHRLVLSFVPIFWESRSSEAGSSAVHAPPISRDSKLFGKPNGQESSCMRSYSVSITGESWDWSEWFEVSWSIYHVKTLELPCTSKENIPWVPYQSLSQ